jgi:hypothetical protein
MRDPDWLVKARKEGRTTERPCGVIIAPPRLDCTEKAFQADVVRLAESLGWEWYHTHDSRRSPSGFPDLVLVRERVVYAELKTESGTLSAEQTHWLNRLKAARAEAYIWRPSAWAAVEAILTRKGAA